MRDVDVDGRTAVTTRASVARRRRGGGGGVISTAFVRGVRSRSRLSSVMGDGGAKGESDAARLASVASTAEALEELGYACAFASRMG